MNVPYTVLDPMGKFSLLGRDAEGRVTSRTDANGKITKYQYDGLGRIIKQTDADNGETVFAYDGLGNLKTLTDARGNITTFTYDLAGRKIKETRPMGQDDEYTYYQNGLLKTVKDAKGQITTYAYDAANRLTQITYADGKIDSFTYNAVGNMLTYSKDGISGSFTYDELNRKTSETVNYGPFAKTYSYTYDNFSNKVTFTTPEGKVYNYAYNKNNQPTSIAFGGKTISYTYQWNRLKKTVLPNGITTDYQYNANTWLTSITAGTVLSEQNTYDNVGNITQKTTENDDKAYAYDLLYQLTQAQGSVLPAETFAYDNIGNRISATEGTDTTAYTHNANNELLSANAANYAYDANGNLVTKTEGPLLTTYIYNSANRMVNVQLPDGRTVTYTYDPFGRRIKKQIDSDTTYYLYADEGLIGEYDAVGTINKAYGWMPDMVWGTAPVFMEENGQHYYYHNDTLGTPRKMTDSTGAVVWSADYTAYGKATVDSSSTVTNNLRFPGQYFDEETGLCYNLNRYYDPGTGRYTSTDPIGLAVDGNTYRYGYNNPALVVDPHGDIGLVGAGIGAVIGGVSGYMYTGTWQGALGGAAIGGAAGFFGQFGTSLGAGMLYGALIGGGEDLAFQMIVQGRSLKCVDFGQAGYSTLIGLGTGGFGHWIEKWRIARQAAKAPKSPIPGRTARVVDARFGNSRTLGAPGADDVFVTAADDIAGIRTSQGMSERLTLLDDAGQMRRGPLTVIEFDTPASGLASPINRSNPGFVGRGLTQGGAREFSLPNLAVDELHNVTRRTVP